MRTIVVVATTLSLTACGIAPERPSQVTPTSTTSTRATSSTPAETTSNSDEDYRVLSYTCGETEVLTVADARATGEDCEANSNSGPTVSQNELDALTTAYGDDDKTTSALDVLWGLCATNIDPAETYPYGLSQEQTKEINGMLSLCPDHPRAADFKKAKNKGRTYDKEIAGGLRFHDGTHVVGKDVQPGTYVVRDVEDCYWERQDANGQTIANDFKLSAARIQVTIAATDHAFVAKGCGEWSRAK